MINEDDYAECTWA